MKSKKQKLIIKDFRQRTKETILSKLIDDDEFYHVNTRWFRLFKQCDENKQLDIIDKIITTQNDFIIKSFHEKKAPIVLEGLGKFIIKPGRRDYIDLMKSDEFDGDREAVSKEVIRRRKIRIEQNRKARKKHLEQPILKIKLKS